MICTGPLPPSRSAQLSQILYDNGDSLFGCLFSSSAMYPPSCMFYSISKVWFGGTLFYRRVSMIGFCTLIKGYSRFTACKLGWFSIRFQKVCICIYHAQNCSPTHSRKVPIWRQYSYLSSGLVNNKGAGQPAHPRSLISAFVFRSYHISTLCSYGDWFESCFVKKHRRQVYFASRTKFIILGPCFYSYSQQRFLFDVLRNS